MGRQFPPPLDEDPGVVLLEDPHMAPRRPSHIDRIRSYSRPHAADPGGVVLYDPLHSTTAAPTKTVSIYNPPRPPASSSHGRAYSHRSHGSSHHTRSTFPQQHATNGRRHPSQYGDTLSHSSGALTIGAIRPGGAVPLMSRAHIGLFFNFMIVGIVDGTIRALMYPVFKIYFHMPSYQQTAAAALVGFGWSCKFVFGFLSDCVPIRGQRRKPYAVIALVILLAFTTGISMMPMVEPYMKPKGVVYNPDAWKQSEKYVVLILFASFGHAILDVASEGLMVEYAHREGEYERGYVQGSMYGARYLGTVLASLVVALGFSSEEYGGSFSYALPQNVVVGFLAVVSACGLYVTYFHLTEEKMVQGSQRLKTHMRSIWRFAERRATWQLTIVFFHQSIVFLYKVPQTDTIYEEWLQGDSLTKGLSYSLASAVYVAGIYVLRSDLLRNVSWRKTIVVTTLISTVAGLVTSWLLAENVYRNKIFNMLATQVVNFCDTFPWMIGVLVIVEIAEPGYEASCYALLTTIYNLAVPIATAAATFVSAGLSLDDDAIIADTASVRHRVMAHYVIIYALRVVVGLGTVFFLPRQKREVKMLMQVGNPNAAVPFAVMITFLLLFVGTWTLVILSMFRATACLSIVGGTGC